MSYKNESNITNFIESVVVRLLPARCRAEYPPEINNEFMPTGRSLAFRNLLQRSDEFYA